MSEIQPDQPTDDTEGHLKHRLVDDGADDANDTDDTEGHKAHSFDASDDEDDTEGHMKHR